MKKIYKGMKTGPEDIESNFEEIENGYVKNTGDEDIAGKKIFTGNIEIQGSLTDNLKLVPFTGSPILADGNVEFFRVGNVVYCNIQSNLKNNVAAAFYALILKEIPTGFKPRSNRTEAFPAFSYNVGTSVESIVKGIAIFNGSTTEGIRMTHPTTGKSESGIFINAHWLTDDAYPTA